MFEDNKYCIGVGGINDLKNMRKNFNTSNLRQYIALF